MRKLPIAIIPTIALTGCGGPQKLSSGQFNAAVNAARDFAERIGGRFVSCSSQDSQNVGYTTCTIVDGRQTVSELRCTYQEGGAGCKAATKQ